MNKYIIFKNSVVARLAQPTAFKEVFASEHWTWDSVAGHNVLLKRMSCKVSSARKIAYPLPGGVTWEFLVTAP